MSITTTAPELAAVDCVACGRSTRTPTELCHSCTDAGVRLAATCTVYPAAARRRAGSFRPADVLHDGGRTLTVLEVRRDPARPHEVDLLLLTPHGGHTAKTWPANKAGHVSRPRPAEVLSPAMTLHVRVSSTGPGTYTAWCGRASTGYVAPGGDTAAIARAFGVELATRAGWPDDIPLRVDAAGTAPGLATYRVTVG